MSEQYPRIHSISTLNIRQHFNCDYRFHTFRTDFSGESGSGKSLIADFIQLLLVGSAVFKSGTEGVNQRDTSGLVLKGEGLKYGRGYLLLNVEIQPRKYLTLGGYLETSSSQMQFFIIQAGYDFEKTLAPMDQPIRYRDLLVNEQIEPLNLLEQTFLQKGYLKSLTAKKYHQLLFDNGILAVDLSQSRQSLKSFAAIIRSFSRGKGFHTDSEALKTFLFGDEDHKRLVERYREEVQSISLDAQQHQRLQEEIDLIRSKEKSIVAVTAAYKTFQGLKQQLSLDRASFWYLNYQHLFQEEQVKQKHYKDNALQRILIQQKLLNLSISDLRDQHSQVAEISRKLRQSGSDTMILQTQSDSAKILLDQSTKNKDVIDKVDEWLNKCNQDLSAVKSWYQQERAKIENTDILNKFTEFLQGHQLVQDFEQSVWFEIPEQAAELSTEKLKEFTITIKHLETQLAFSDVQNPDSLAGWAMQHLPFPLSLEQESMLIHFQPLPRTAPETPKDRYLPFPENLFDQPVIVKTQTNGFWLELSGIYEYIEHTPVQYLNVPLDQVNFDLTPLAGLRKLLIETQATQQRLQELKHKLESYAGLIRSVDLYRQSQSNLFPEIDEVGELTISEFNRHLQIHATKDALLVNYEEKLSAYERTYQNWLKSQSGDLELADRIMAINKAAEKQYGSTDFDGLVKEKESKLATWNTAFTELDEQENISTQDIQQSESLLFKTSPSLSRLYEMGSASEANYHQSKKNLSDIQGSLGSAKIKLQDARLHFLQDYKRDFDPAKDLVEVAQLPDDTACNSAENKFIFSYDAAAESIEDKTILSSYSVGILAHKLLPTVFQTHQIREDLIGEQIDQRLSDLTRDLQQIGSRKIEILHRVFNEVEKTYNDYLTKVQHISNYLRHKDRAITGGSHATLLPKSATGFPDDWMKVFRKRLNNEIQNTGLFAPTNQQDIDQIMVSVFREAGGKKEAGYQDLLDPKAYFDLIFDIKLEDGQSNAGSNGQTYTANALLCLARLSLIEDSERSGIRIMPIDEAEGLGSNYEMLHALAKRERYQLVTMSIETAGDVNSEGQYIYIMHDNKDSDGMSYVPPLGIFNNGAITKNIHEIFDQTE